MDHYDAVIVGSGFGGAFTAHALARAGLRTLLVERGGHPRRDADDWSPSKILIEQRYRGRSPIQVTQYDRPESEVHPNEVVGGNSVFYGGASLRLREADFRTWPFDCRELEPHYTAAEELLDVHGRAGSDPEEPPRIRDYPREPAELSTPAQRIYDAAVRLGFRPFPLPMALNFMDNTRPVCIRCMTCDGFPCKIEAKNDLAVTVLRSAQRYGLEIRACTVALRLQRSGGRISQLECADADSGQRYTVSADRFVVAAGALHTPALLQYSGLSELRGGDWIGRRLMRHCNAVVTGIFRFRTNPAAVFHKQLCFTEFYEDLRAELGTATGVIQDIYTPAAEVLRHHAPPGLRAAAAALTGFMQNLLCIAEDEPSPNNRVSLGDKVEPFGVPITRVHHRYSADDYRRRDHLIERARRILKCAGALITRVYEIDSFSHGVGTVAMADSPEGGAINRDCRLWDVDNLWITDGGCFPTSGGVNPSLTIAANALRVAPAIISGGSRS
ncbi:MAG: GMC family oxidoreductase [Candidatus Latescibacterota bacterium]|nr:GMC family oxidoreductase [Candidatus Latescibacterota bacterium]